MQDTDTLARRLKLLNDNAEKDYRIPLYDEGIMEAWKTFVATITVLPAKNRDRLLSAIGGLKGLQPLRHWIAHGRYWELPGGIKRYPPATVATDIKKLFDALRDIAQLGNLRQFK